MHQTRAHLDPVPIVFRGLSRCAHLFLFRNENAINPLVALSVTLITNQSVTK